MDRTTKLDDLMRFAEEYKRANPMDIVAVPAWLLEDKRIPLAPLIGLVVGGFSLGLVVGHLL